MMKVSNMEQSCLQTQDINGWYFCV